MRGARPEADQVACRVVPKVQYLAILTSKTVIARSEATWQSLVKGTLAR